MSGRQIALGSLGVLLAACSSKPLDTGSPGGDRVWTETSSSLEVACFGYWQGSMRFVAARDQLSSSQLDMLSRMTAVDGDTSCWADVMTCSLIVGAADGHTRMIDAIEENSVCDSPRKVVLYDTFNPFRLSLGCQYAKELAAGRSLTGDPAPPVTADPRCYNGLFTTGEESLITVPLGVDDTAAPHRIELDDCAQPGRVGKLSFTVFDSDGATILGSSATPADPGPDGTCAALDMTFPHSGGFPLEVAVAAGTMPGGDLSLRFY